MSDIIEALPWSTAHQRAGIGYPAGGFTIAFWALDVPVFRNVAGDNDALFGTAVVNFSHAIGVIAVDDTFRAGEIRRVEDERSRRRRGMRDQTSHAVAVGERKHDWTGPPHLLSAIPDYVISACSRQLGLRGSKRFSIKIYRKTR